MPTASARNQRTSNRSSASPHARPKARAGRCGAELALRGLPWLCAAALWGLMAVSSPVAAAPPVDAPPVAGGSDRASSASSPAAAGEDTSASGRIVLQLREDVELGSAIVRLSDVAVPVGTAPKEWARAASATIGLLPIDGRRLRIERQRLSEMLQQSNLLGRPVRLSGPQTVSIRFVPPSSEGTHQGRKTPVVSQIAPDAAGPEEPLRRASSSADPDRSEVQAAAATVLAPATQSALEPAERNRILRMVQAAFEQLHDETHRRYELSIDERQDALSALDGLRAIRSLQISGAPEDGRVSLVISGDTELESVETSLAVELRALPLAVVARQSLNRGDLVSARDVELEPVRREHAGDALINDIRSVVGMEMQRPVSAGRFIGFDDITPPIVIRRNDMVELRIVGAGVTVTTAARALGPASVGEPVTVETQSPRRRLIGHAAASGVVEIVTRPPTTASMSARRDN